jgi:hypothetical protein
MTIRWLSALLDFPADTFSDEVTFWRAIAGSTVSPARGADRQFASLEPFNGDPHLRVQRVREGLGGVHLDLHVDDMKPSMAHARALGAHIVSAADDVVVLTSPGGFGFCLVPWNGEHERSRPIRWPGDTISIIDQLCIDIPAKSYDDECNFWAALTGWSWRQGVMPEFRNLQRPKEMPLRILLQKISSKQIGGHLDLASTHPDEEVSRHEGWGAKVEQHHRFWTVMSDPFGRRYCITHRNPRSGNLPQ